MGDHFSKFLYNIGRIIRTDLPKGMQLNWNALARIVQENHSSCKISLDNHLMSTRLSQSSSVGFYFCGALFPIGIKSFFFVGVHTVDPRVCIYSHGHDYLQKLVLL